MMDAVDEFELAHHGVYPIAFDRRWHCGMHLAPSEQTEPVRAIADGDVVAYRVSQKAISDGQLDRNGNPALNSNNGFVLLKHKTDTGEGRTITFYSLYMHLLDINAQQIIAPQPTTPPVTGSASALPAWLLQPTDGVRVGGNKKVYRKDILGYWGQCHGQPHLHFEIFMAEADFNDYFGHTQLGSTAPTTPTTNDCWGHSYYVIPAGQAFVSVPPGRTGSLYFPALKDGTLDASSKLYVEAYFHKGQRYTRSWIESGGTLTLLTAQPIRDAYEDYEYKLYQRAMDLYPKCPSAGYEMLRFGRVLSTGLEVLSEAESRTWVAVTYGPGGTQGYVDICQRTVKKLSDADFPFFTGWQKIDETNTPFSQDGMCDYDELLRIVNVVEASQTAVQRKDPEYIQEDQLTAYVYGNAAVRRKLVGFVCHAPSEWDKRSNETRYGRLNQPDGFFGKRRDFDPNGYANFLRFLEHLQFLDQVPVLSGNKKFWFFHPLAFIRHFRRCGWHSLRELTQTLPRRSSLNAGGNITWQESQSRWGSGTRLVGSMPENINISINEMWRKYGFSTPHRRAHFLAQVFKESGALRKTLEDGDTRYFRTMYEVLTPQEAAEDFDQKLSWLRAMGFLRGRDRPTYIAQRPGEVANKAQQLGNTQAGDGARFCGRGLIHLTGRKGYEKYGAYCKSNFSNDPRPQLLSTNAQFAADSAGYFWVSKIMQSPDSGALRSGINISRRADVGVHEENVAAVTTPVNGGSAGLSERKEFFKYVNFILGDGVLSPADMARQIEG
ncbi:M23 family metallopeptidase [Cupriavidus necator]|uniref:Uncharacterized protein n=1 Tax=Cupriavidus pinatubonensis (strain JMP 134 / LMG 1197) TaxID=264198 RepID=Q477N6_CUPPJ|nr:M23 family metallopeptidase [Cupriavidus necator]